MSTPQLNHCSDGGYLVNCDEWLPDTPWDYDWGADYPRIGCSHVHCARCDCDVRVFPLQEKRIGVPLTPATLYACPVSQQPPELRPASLTRVYTCRCATHTETAADPLDPREPDPSHPLSLPWRCAGHEAFPLPGSLDGILIGDATDYDALARDALARRIPQLRPWKTINEKRLPAFWLARLYVLANEPTYRTRIAEAVGRALRDPDRWVRRGAINFYLFHPLAPGAELLADLLAHDLDLFDGVPDPETAKRDLGYYLRHALEERLRIANDDGSLLDPGAMAAARADLMFGRGSMGFVFSVGRADPSWMLHNGPAIVTRRPDLAGAVVRVFRDQPTPIAVAAVTALASSGAISREALRDSLSGFSEPNRSAMLEALGAGSGST